MLAYVFWHRPRDGTGASAYEEALVAFHRSLARTPPVGLRGSCALRVQEIPWLAAEAGGASERNGGAQDAADEGGYEDWYLLADFTALGVLNEAAVGRGHRTVHDRAARHFGAGAGGLYGLVEGEPDAGTLGDASLAIWIARPLARGRASTPGALGELLGDGMDPSRASLWRRALVLGPAPEYCLLARETSPGVAPTRLPSGWRARALERQLLFSS